MKQANRVTRLVGEKATVTVDTLVLLSLTPHRPAVARDADFITANERYFLYFLLSAGFLFIMCVHTLQARPVSLVKWTFLVTPDPPTWPSTAG